METMVYKNSYGWTAETTIPAPELGPNKVVKILTMKRNNGALTTTAQIAKIEGSFMSFKMFSDYRENLIVNKKPRVTERAVKEQQETALAMVPQTIENAKVYYAEQAAKLSAEGPFTVIAGA